MDVRTRAEERPSLLWTPLGSRSRWVLAAAALVAAVAHVPVIGPHLAEAPYLGEEFVVLTVACLLLALAALVCDSAAVYGLAVLTCGLGVLGYLATRLIAFPQLGDDVGNWLEPLGIVSIAAEAVGFGAAAGALLAAFGPRTRRRPATSQAWVPGRLSRTCG